MTSGIYCIENKLNGKKYIGQGIDVQKRMRETHNSSSILSNAIKKHGRINFKKQVLIYCEEWELNRLEIECIKISNSHFSKGGYNVSFGGDASFKGRNHSKKTKAILRNTFLKEKSPVFGLKYPDSSSKYHGVVLYNQKQTIKGKEYNYLYWIAKLRVDRKWYNLGYFKDEISAAKAYDIFVMENSLKNPLNFSMENLKL